MTRFAIDNIELYIFIVRWSGIQLFRNDFCRGKMCFSAMVRATAESGFFRAIVTTAVESATFPRRLSLTLFLRIFALLLVDCFTGNWDRPRILDLLATIFTTRSRRRLTNTEFIKGMLYPRGNFELMCYMLPTIPLSLIHISEPTRPY